MAKLFRKGKVQKIVAIVLGLVSVAGAVFGVSALAKYAKEEQKTIKPAFSVGGLTEAGVYEETDDMIYTKDAFEAKGLEIKLDFDSNVKYQVFFYDELDKFISCTEVYTESQDISVPLEARARLEVTPIWGADAPLEKEIKWYETAKYANQLEIRVDKRQELLERDFIKYNLNEIFTVKKGQCYEEISGNFVENEEYDSYVYTCDSYEGMYFNTTKYYESSLSNPSASLSLIVKRKDGSAVEVYKGNDFLNVTYNSYLKLAPGDEVIVRYYKCTSSVALESNVFVYFA